MDRSKCRMDRVYGLRSELIAAPASWWRRILERSAFFQRDFINVGYIQACIPTLSPEWPISCQNHRISPGVTARQFQQAPVNRPRSRDEAGIHVQEPYNFLIHAHIFKFLVDTSPEFALTMRLRLSYPVIEFDAHGVAGCCHLPKRVNILGASLVGWLVADEPQVLPQILEPEFRYRVK